MADMELVIKIPEHAYEECKKAKLTEALEGVPFHVMKAIANGTPLPKGHGRLVDADMMTNRLCTNEASDFFGSVTCAEISDFIDSIRPIIEADKAESDEV